MNTIASRLKRAMEKGLGPDGEPWSGRSLAREAGLAEPHVGMILRGESKKPREQTIRALARALGVSIAWLGRNEGGPSDPFVDYPAGTVEVSGPGQQSRVLVPMRFSELNGWSKVIAELAQLFPEIPEEAFKKVGELEIQASPTGEDHDAWLHKPALLKIVTAYDIIPGVDSATINERTIRLHLFDEDRHYFKVIALSKQVLSHEERGTSLGEDSRAITELLSVLMDTNPVVAAAIRLDRAQQGNASASHPAYVLASTLVRENLRRTIKVRELVPLLSAYYGMDELRQEAAKSSGTITFTDATERGRKP